MIKTLEIYALCIIFIFKLFLGNKNVYDYIYIYIYNLYILYIYCGITLVDILHSSSTYLFFICYVYDITWRSN